MPHPTDINNVKATTGCLLIHGFGGNISEVRPLAERLEAKGFIVECPSLKGHTGKRNDLKKCTYDQWVISAKEGYEKLQSLCKTIYIIGFSMGGLITLQLALNNNVNGIVTLNSPIYYWDFKRVFLNIAADIKSRKYDNLHKYISSIYRLPAHALYNFRVLLGKTKPILNLIKCPIFIAQALQDDTVNKRSADFMFRNIGSETKKIQYYNNSGHLILWSKVADSVMNDVEEFLHACRTD